MQRYTHDGGTSEIDVLYDVNLGSRISGGSAKEVYTKTCETQAGSVCGGGWLRQLGYLSRVSLDLRYILILVFQYSSY